MVKQGEIIFNSQSSVDLNLKLENYPVIPMSSEEFEKVPMEGRNGYLVMNKGTYPNKEVKFIFTRICDDIDEMDEIYDWLTNVDDSRLIYGRSDRVYRVKKVVFGDFKKEFLRFGEIEVTFIFEPFMEAFDVTNIQLTNTDYIFNYPGTAPAGSVITIHGSGNIQFIINDEIFSITNVSEFIVIDNELKQTRDKNGQSKDFDVIGDYFLFDKGNYNVGYIGNVSMIEIEFTTKYL